MTKFQRLGSEKTKLTSIIKGSRRVYRKVYYRKAQSHYRFMSPFLFDAMYVTKWVYREKKKKEISRGDRAWDSSNALLIAI